MRDLADRHTAQTRTRRTALPASAFEIPLRCEVCHEVVLVVDASMFPADQHRFSGVVRPFRCDPCTPEKKT